MAVGIKTNLDSETLDTSPGGLFTDPDQVSSIDITTIEGHLDDAVEAARAAKGWAVGNDSLPLTGYSATNNSEYYSEQAAQSATASADSAGLASASATTAGLAADRAGMSATAAAASAIAAAMDAATADSDAATALAAATTATNQAGIATTQAGIATTQAGIATTAAEGAQRDSELIAMELAEARALAAEVRILNAEVDSDSEAIARVRVEIDSDTRAIDSDLRAAERLFAEIDSEAQVAEAYAVGTGRLAGEGEALDSEEGRSVLGTRNFITDLGTQYVEAIWPNINNTAYPSVDLSVRDHNNNVVDINVQDISQVFQDGYSVDLFHNYVRQGIVTMTDTPQGNSAADRRSPVRRSLFTTPPITGDIIHIFVTETGRIPAYQSAYFQAQRSEYFSREALRFDSDARRRDSEITDLVTGANARIDSEKRVRAAADTNLQRQLTEQNTTDTELRTRIDNIEHGHARIINGEHFNAGDGILLINGDSDSDTITIDRSVVVVRTGLDSEVSRLDTRIDSDGDALDALEARLDSEKAARLSSDDSDADAIAREVTQRILSDDSDALGIRSLGLRDSELQIELDSDAAIIRKLGLRDSEFQTEIDSDAVAVRRIDSELQAIREALDSEGGAAGSFRSLNDTPSAYGTDSDYVRMNRTGGDPRLEFFNPFPVTNNRLTSLNGLRIRRFETDAIVFATFEPSNLSLRADPSNFVQWDRTINGFEFRGTNDALVQETFLTNITNYTVNGNARTISTNYMGYDSAARTWIDPITFIADSEWTGGSEQYEAMGTINDSAGGTYVQMVTFGWNTPSWNGPSDDWGSMRFDAQQGDVTVTATPLTDSEGRVTNVTIGGGAATESGLNFSRVFTGPYFYDSPAINANYSGTFTKPAHSNSNASRSATVTHNYSADHGDIYFPTFLTTANTLGTITNSGYGGADSRSVSDQDLNLWRSRRYEFINSNDTAETHYIWAPSTATGFTDPDSLNAPIAGVVHVTENIGQSGHQRPYNRYAFTVAANSTLRADPTS